MEMDIKPTMFVVNVDELDTAPRQIFFNLEDAVDDGAEYIDVFDENGIRICHYEKEGKEYIQHMA